MPRKTKVSPIFESRMKTRFTLLKLSAVCCSLFAVLSAATSFAQIRSNALDASPQIGAGGYNSPSRAANPYAYGGGGIGNLYITGNVSGGKSFRGFVPYSDPTQFQGSLGSADLNSFERNAIDLRRVQQGYSGSQALPYYNRSSTIFPLSAQGQGYTVPGSSIPRFQLLPQPLNYGLRAIPPRPMLEASTPLPPNIRATDILVPGIVIPIEGQAQKPYLAPYEELKAPMPTPTPAPSGEITQPLVQPMAPEQPQDFSQWLALQAEKEQKAKVSVGPQPQHAQSANRMAVEGKLAGQPQPKLAPPRVVTELAGKGKDPFSRGMRIAQESLVRGNFYEAYRQYGQSLSLKPDDPLPLYGQAHALIAAGELRSAGEHLERAITKFPKLLRLQLDGARLLGSKAVLDRRREQLETLSVKNGDNRLLMFLRGYVELLSGHRDEGLRQIAASSLVPTP